MSAALLAGATLALAAQGHDHHQAAPPAQPATSRSEQAPPPMDSHAGHTMPEADPSLPVASPMDHQGHTVLADANASHDMTAMGDHKMVGALGAYPMGREASGTAWQPDVSPHGGVMVHRGDWMLMGHAVFNGVHSWQEGPRGGDKTFLAGMVMGMAQRGFDNGGQLRFRGMLSPDPLMGKRGYPILLASGETADGLEPLIDRQHPHDLFMELSASYSRPIGESASAFVYAGWPGEPAFGPPAFMHRLSIMDSPEAPISHHWLDSTHITFGVLTAGVVAGDWKVEASRFKGREPDESRYDLDNPKLDSTAVRLSWNPTPNWSLQASYADVKSPEQLEPDEDQTKWSASAIYTVPVGEAGWWSTTAAWGRRSTDHDPLDAWVLESAVKPNAAWTFFARAERTENNELAGDHGHHGPAYTVGKVSVGAIRDFRLSDQVAIGVGGLYGFNFLPDDLEASYGGDPNGAMAFVRLKIG